MKADIFLSTWTELLFMSNLSLIQASTKLHNAAFV